MMSFPTGRCTSKVLGEQRFLRHASLPSELGKRCIRLLALVFVIEKPAANLIVSFFVSN